MLGTLVRMSGIPTQSEMQDIVLRWLVCGDRDQGDIENPVKFGNLLVRAYTEGFCGEDEGVFGDRELVDFVFKYFSLAYRQRVAGELKRRGLETDHLNDDWVREQECFPGFWNDVVDLSSVRMPESLAKRLGECWGDSVAAQSIDLWLYADEMNAC